MSNELYPEQMREICKSLGWQGGTYWQALDAIKHLRRSVKDAPLYRIGQTVRCKNDGPEFVVLEIKGLSRADGVWLYTYRGAGIAADESQIAGLA